MNKQQDTHSYQGWLNSDSFLKRALAVLGYACVGHILLMVAVVVLYLGLVFTTMIGAAFMQ